MDDEYKCERCGYTSEDITNFRRHLTRKSVCEVKFENIDISILRDRHLAPKKDKSLSCNICNKQFASRSGLHVHKKKCIQPVAQSTSTPNVSIVVATDVPSTNTPCLVTNDSSIDIVMLKEQLRQELIEEFRNMINTQNHQPITINNNINNNINNTIINTVNVNNFGSEDVSHITPEFLSYCIENPRKGMRSLIENIHFHPEYNVNHNLRCKSLKANVFEKCVDNQWILCDASNTLEELIRKGYRILNAHYTEHFLTDPVIQGDEIKQRAYERFRFLSDTTCNDYYAVKRDLRLLVKDKTMYILELPNTNEASTSSGVLEN